MVFRKKDSGPSSRHHAMLIVSRYQIITLKRSSPKSNVKPLYLIDLSRISMPKSGMLLLEFGRQTGVPIVEQYDTAKAPEILHTIRGQHALICLGMPDHCQLQVDVAPEAELPPKQLPPIGIAGGFIDSYRVWCNFYSEQPSEELIQYITDSVERTPYILELSYCPGIEPGTNITFSLKPVFQALRFNSYFLGLYLCDLVAKGAMELLVPCLKSNRVLTRLHLRNLVTSHLTLVGTSLAENGPNALQEIDFSGTRISEKAIRAISLSVVVKEFGLRSWKMSKCELSAKGIATLFREGFLPSPEVTLSLEELDISENKIDEEASLLLQVWISKIGKRGNLRVLNIAKTSAVLGLILPALESLVYLEELNISHSQLDLDSAQVLAKIIGLSSCFKTIDVSHCGLAPSCLSVLLAAVVKNPNLQGCKLKFAGNSLDDTSINLMIGAFTPSRCLHTLDLSHLKLGEAGMLNLFNVIVGSAPTLKSLVLIDFFSSISGHIQGARIGHALADLILQIPQLDKLDISLSKHGMFSSTGPSHVLLPFIQRMQRNETLLELVMVGNRLADQLAVNLAEMLRCNTTLISLDVDDNKITLTGFQALEYAMQRNRTLQRFVYPTMDVSRCVKSGMSTEKLSVLFGILSNIQLAVNLNQSNGEHSYLKSDDYNPPQAGHVLVYDSQQAPAPPVPTRTEQHQPMQTEQPQQYENSNSWGDASQSQTQYEDYSYNNSGYDGNYSGYEEQPAPVVDQQQWNSYQTDPAPSGGANSDLFSALASVLEDDSGSYNSYENSQWQ
mmetsp:Transcript_1510/g.1926  ORF Transcript_1510/g.1926 Transcript_1510/m.1926 type:complete len:785 (-) Transcript_1510:29-2383(-)|eukprot:CAMPEP_0206187880 /NCGR_PEP_ID=MMETSP0166-20121206/3260_1 /ASSEMBLY_ACC=CAM_ASM_000260 /TAXON_ID=95228 /ORGANISM="Vannella robusta, Strain DIVA3 518/3/11/1/6" /LENGTH=784 /DNA_ID=CAMNT_0053603537 /DNA_START=512 /DNA_END=2866 /DNA_ORIENTATION=+